MILNWSASWLLSNRRISSKESTKQNDLPDIENDAIIVMKERDGMWQVAYRASFWYAYASKHSIFHPGDVVRVIGRIGISLLIEKAE